MKLIFWKHKGINKDGAFKNNDVGQVTTKRGLFKHGQYTLLSTGVIFGRVYGITFINK